MAKLKVLFIGGSGVISSACARVAVESGIDLYALNRGILLTPFHNMALMCPATTAADIELHTRVFAEAVQELAG